MDAGSHGHALAIAGALAAGSPGQAVPPHHHRVLALGAVGHANILIQQLLPSGLCIPRLYPAVSSFMPSLQHLACACRS